jgi:hypothetical protein
MPALKISTEVDSVTALPEGTQETCDADGPGVIAAYLVNLPSGRQLSLCSHHAYSFFGHQATEA